MRIEAHVVSDRGKVKENNEDNGGTFFENRLLVVADGMGGGAAGEYASKQAVDQIREVVAQAKYYEDGVGIKEEGPGRPVGSKGIEAAVQHANTFLYSMSRTQETLKGMGTTVVCCLIESNRAHFANLGDSRGYIFREGRLTQVTKDHSLFSDPKYNKSNVITRALGQKSYAEVDLFEEPLQPGDVILLCSDGLDKVVPDEKVAAVLARKDTPPADLATRLVEMANAGGGPDNITAAVARIEGELDEVADAPPPVAAAADEPTVDNGAPGEIDFDDERTAIVDVRGAVPKAPPPEPSAPAASTEPADQSGVRAAAAEPPEKPAEAARKRKGRGRGLLLLAVIGVLVVILAVVIGNVLKAPAVAPSELVVELRKTRSEVVPGAKVSIKAGAEELWVANVLQAGTRHWELQVVTPRPARGSHRVAFGEVVRLPIQTQVDRGAVLSITNAEGEDRVMAAIGEPLTRLWDVGQRAYSVRIETRAYSQGVGAVWEELVENGLEAAQEGLEDMLSQLSSDGETRREQAWFDEVEKAHGGVLRAADEINALLAADPPVSREDVLSRHADLAQASERLDRLCPGAGDPLTPRLLDVGLVAESQRLALILEGIGRVDVEREQLRVMVRDASADAEVLGPAVAGFEELVANLGLVQTAEEARLVADARRAMAPAERPTDVTQQSTRVADRRPTRRPTARAAGSSRETQVVVQLGELEVSFGTLTQRCVKEKQLNAALSAEVGTARSRAVSVIGPLMDRKRSSKESQALEKAMRSWVILENSVIRFSRCDQKPNVPVLATFSRAVPMAGDKKGLGQKAVDRYEECP